MAMQPPMPSTSNGAEFPGKSNIRRWRRRYFIRHGFGKTGISHNSPRELFRTIMLTSNNLDLAWQRFSSGDPAKSSKLQLLKLDFAPAHLETN
jgi:hypothetical protein